MCSSLVLRLMDGCDVMAIWEGGVALPLSQKKKRKVTQLVFNRIRSVT